MRDEYQRKMDDLYEDQQSADPENLPDETATDALDKEEYPPWHWQPDADGVHRPPVILWDGDRSARVKYFDKDFRGRIIGDKKKRKLEIPVLKNTPFWEEGTELPTSLRKNPYLSHSGQLLGYAFFTIAKYGLGKRD